MRALTAAARDPEALQPAPGARTCRPLDWALGAALLLLAAACATCAALSWAMPAAPSSAPSSSSLTGACVQGPDHPQDAFAQLVASNVLLTNGTLRWHSERGLAEVSLAPGLTYDTLKRELVVAQGGVYYVFLHLELRRVVAGSGSGSVSVALHLQPDQTAALTLVLDLLAASSDSAGSSRGLLLRLGSGQRLAVHMRASAGAHPAWQLAQGATVLGLFRVAPEDPTGLSPPSPRPT